MVSQWKLSASPAAGLSLTRLPKTVKPYSHKWTQVEWLLSESVTVDYRIDEDDHNFFIIMHLTQDTPIN